MDIQRAVEILKINKPTSDPRLCGKELCNACDVAISAMQELQQYLSTGLTPRMIETLKENDKRSHRLAVQRATELDEYQEIGTPEECREAMKKQNAIEVTDIHVDEYYCPACGAENNCDQGIIGDKYCPNCGQAIKQSNCRDCFGAANGDCDSCPKY